MASSIERFRTVRKRAFPLVIGTALGVVAACGGDSDQATTGNLGNETGNSNLGDLQAVPSLPSSEVPLTHTPTSLESEFSGSERAIIDLGDWQMVITGWEEIESFEGGVLSKDPDIEGDFKYVVVNTYFRNISDKIANTETILEQEGDFGFRLADSRGVLLSHASTFAYYTYEGGLLEKPYIDQADAKPLYLEYSGSNGLEVPPGFGIKLGLIFLVPRDSNDYGLAVEPKRTGLPNPHDFVQDPTDKFLSTADPDKIARKGERAQDFEIVYPELEISPLNKEFIYEHPQKAGLPSQTFSFRFDGLLAKTVTEPGYGGIIQRVGLTVTNISSSPSYRRDVERVDFGGEEVDDVKLTVYLTDGRVIPALYGDLETVYMEVGDSLQAKATIASMQGILIGTRGWDHPALHGLLSQADLEGAIVVLVAPQNDSWIAWKLPDASLAR